MARAGRGVEPVTTSGNRVSSGATAPHVGPFAAPRFAEVLHSHWGRGELVAARSDQGVAMVELVDTRVVGVGPRDLVDYRSPVGPDGVELLAGLVADRAFRLDSMPEEVAMPLADILRSGGRVVDVEEEDSTAVVHLPATFDDWLLSIGKKERHETRRKRRRYEELVGSPRIARFVGSEERLAEFVALHRTSAGEKGSFMTEEMAAFFRDLMHLPGWGIDALVSEEGSIVASGFGYHGDDGYYLYNSAYDPTFREASPGVVMIASLIEFAIEEGQELLDFLKGEEAYKYRLGAERRPLFTVVGSM